MQTGPAAPPPATTDAVGQGLTATLPAPEPSETPLPPAADPEPDAFAPDTHDPAPDENTGEMASTAPPDDAIAAERPETPAQPAADDVVAPGAAEATSAAQDASSAPAAELATPSPAADTRPPAVCHAWANLTPDQADRLSQRLRRIGVTPIRTRTETPDSWWVRIPPQRSRAEAERRVVELNLLGVTDTFIVPEAGATQYAVSLGVFKTENRARVLLGQLRDRGVTNAGIEPRVTTTYRIQADVPTRELRTVESAAPGLRGRRQTCAPR